MGATENLNDVLRFWAMQWPDRVGVMFRDEPLTWGELDRQSDQIAAGLHAAGVRKGDNVGILMRNRFEFVESLHAILKLGAAAVLLNIRFTAREMVYPLVDSGISVAIVDGELVHVMAEASKDVPSLRLYTTEPVDGCRHLDDLRSSDAPPDTFVDGTDTALVCYTSGTTGVAKGALLTHGNLRSAGLSRVVPAGINYTDRMMMPLPLAYTGGTSSYFRDGLVPGARTYLEPDADPVRLMELIERERITSWPSVPVMFEMLMNHPRFGDADLTCLKHAVAAGSAVSLDLLKTWQAKGVPIAQGYGMTETGGSYATILYADQAESHIGFAGRHCMHVSVRIVDDDMNTLPAGETGEIAISGPTIMKGYLNKPEETAKAMRDGWMRSGDMGFMDDEGFLKIVDRSKDMLISGGLNVYPAEIERILAGVPGLEEFTVIGVKDVRWGEVPMVVVPNAAAVDMPALRAKCQQELADYKRPKYVAGLGEPLPRTISGKILKREVRDRYAEAPADALTVKET